MRFYVTSFFVDGQKKALDFYANVPGFQKKRDIPLGDASWLTVVSPEQPDGTELLLEPSGHRAVKPSSRSRMPWSRTGSRPHHSRSTTCRRSSIGCDRRA
jgi:catechol 2,3-dioxygenase-like lactoylglutathione lyase family enzyme